MTKQLDQLLNKADDLLSRLEQLLPQTPTEIDWDATAWLWVKHGQQGQLQAVTHPHEIRLDDIQFLDQQKETLIRNTQQFLQGLPANHALLTL